MRRERRSDGAGSGQPPLHWQRGGASSPTPAPPAGGSETLHVPLAGKAIAAVGVAGVLIVACWFFRYAHASADDYVRGGRVRREGALGAVAWEYKNWSGRWGGIGASCLTWSVLDLSDPWNYRLALVCLAGVSAACLHFFVATVLGLRLLGGKAAVVTLCLLCLYWTGALSPGETTYWLSAGTEYHLGAAVALLVVGGVIRVTRSRLSGRRAAAWTAALTLPAFVAPGIHELLGVLLCMVLAVGTFLAWRSRIQGRWVWSAVVLAAAAGMLVVALAPGNAARQAQLQADVQTQAQTQVQTKNSAPWNVGRTLEIVKDNACAFLPGWLCDARLWGATLLLLLLGPACGIPPAWARADGPAGAAQGGPRWGFWVPATWGAAMVILFVAPPLLTGAGTPFRTTNITYLAFLLGWFLTVIVFAPGLTASLPRAGAAPLAMALLVLWPVSLMGTGNTPKALSDLAQKDSFYPLPAYSTENGRIVGDLAQRLYEARLRLVVSPSREAADQERRAAGALLGKLREVFANKVEMTRLEAFDHQMRFRDDCLKAQIAAGKTNVGLLELMPPFPRMYMDMDVTDISNKPPHWVGPNVYWTNKAVADYYALESVGAVAP